ncbi:hypothetical protein J2P12_04170 [Candidatus Bathyarchaeota archaeon]|nr:hypothetical protein [Candidatus Bathyarchaeota archaeon]
MPEVLFEFRLSNYNADDTWVGSFVSQDLALPCRTYVTALNWTPQANMPNAHSHRKTFI